MVFSPRFTITRNLSSSLAAIEHARGFLDGAKLAPSWIQKMQEAALILEAHHTTHIEGTQLTLDQSEKLLAGKEVSGADPNDAKELLNYRDAFEFVASYVLDHKRVTEGVVREIHKRLVQGVRGDKALPGEYRKVQNYVVNSNTGEVIYTPPGAHEVPLLMHELIDWLRVETSISPILKAGIAQFQLVHIHPFLDGNGRSARLLSSLVLFLSGYDFKKLFTISEYYDRDRPAYYLAIQAVRENNLDLTGFLEYFCEGLKSQLLEVERKGALELDLEELMMIHNLTERQKATLLHIRESHVPFSIQAYQNLYPEVSRRTLQRDLTMLVNKGLIEKIGAKKGTQYIPTGSSHPLG